MRLTVLGSCGAWPEAGQACSGYLIEHDGFRLVVDLGYATLPRLPNVGVRIEAGGAALAYTGLPEDADRYLSSARTAGQSAARARVRRLLLTHLWPGTDPAASQAVARGQFDGDAGVASAGTAVEVG